MAKCYNAKLPIHKREYFGGGELGVNWVINALSCVFNNIGICRFGLELMLLARRQGLHVEGIISVLGGCAEPLVKANQKSGSGALCGHEPT